jgi:hypothetical protein
VYLPRSWVAWEQFVYVTKLLDSFSIRVQAQQHMNHELIYKLNRQWIRVLGYQFDQRNGIDSPIPCYNLVT